MCDVWFNSGHHVTQSTCELPHHHLYHPILSSLLPPQLSSTWRMPTQGQAKADQPLFWSRRWEVLEDMCQKGSGLIRCVLTHFLRVLGAWGCVWKLNIAPFRIGSYLDDRSSFRFARTEGEGGTRVLEESSLNRFVLSRFLLNFDVWGCVGKLTSTPFRIRLLPVDMFRFRLVRSVLSSRSIIL